VVQRARRAPGPPECWQPEDRSPEIAGCEVHQSAVCGIVPFVATDGPRQPGTGSTWLLIYQELEPMSLTVVTVTNNDEAQPGGLHGPAGL
jgi:hypothetical protein